MDIIEKIKKLKVLLDQGAINVEEFNSLKKKVLSEASDINEHQETISPSSTTETSPVQEETKKPSSNVKKPIKKVKKFEEVQTGAGYTEGLAYLVLGAAILLSIVFWVRYSSFLVFVIVLAVSYLIPWLIGKVTPKALHKNLYFVALIVLYVILISYPIGKKNSSSSSSDQTESAQTNNQSPDQKIGQFLINHTFADDENGFTFYMKFTSKRDGTYGAVTLSMGVCDAVYSYNLSGRSIQMTFTGTTCPNTSGSSTTATFNYENTISLFYKGEQFVFKPL